MKQRNVPSHLRAPGGYLVIPPAYRTAFCNRPWH
jgi:hypothetical protein